MNGSHYNMVLPFHKSIHCEQAEMPKRLEHAKTFSSLLCLAEINTFYRKLTVTHRNICCLGSSRRLSHIKCAERIARICLE